MKNILTILTLSFLIISCQSNQGWPDDLDGKKALLQTKKEELKSIKTDIDKLKEEIIELEPMREKDPILVSTKTLDKEEFNRFTTVQASVESDDKVYLSSETGGRLTSVTVDEGDYVRKGQLLATVDLKTLSDQLAEIETSLSLARDVFDRQKRLWDQKIGTEIQYLQAKNNVERLEKSIATLNSQMAKANIYAPISGVVNMEFLKPGELAGPGTPILEILNTSRLKVVADVPESYIKNIKKGDAVEVYIPALDKTYKKSVSLIGRTIDPSNRTFKVEVNVGNPGGALKPNLLAELKFNDFSTSDVITVPVQVILEEVSGEKFVFVAAQDGGKKVAKKKYISTGESYENDIIVESGLTAGDEVIIDGARSVSVGDKVVSTNSGK